MKRVPRPSAAVAAAVAADMAAAVAVAAAVAAATGATAEIAATAGNDPLFAAHALAPRTSWKRERIRCITPGGKPAHVCLAHSMWKSSDIHRNGAVLRTLPVRAARSASPRRSPRFALPATFFLVTCLKQQGRKMYRIGISRVCSAGRAEPFEAVQAREERLR